MQYLIDSDVDLVIGHPNVTKISTPLISNPKSYFWTDIDVSLLPTNSKIISLPINKNYKVSMLYISENHYIDEIIEQRGLEVHKIKIEQ